MTGWQNLQQLLGFRTTGLLITIMVLMYQLLGACATFSIYISRSQLETYFQGSEDFNAIRGQMVDIVRDGQSLIGEDGSLQLTEATTTPPPSVGSGSGNGPLFLMSTMATILPPLPSQINNVAMTWVATTNVSYELSLVGSPSGHFRDIGSNISTSGFIPSKESDFSLRFLCGPNSVGKGRLLINISTTVITTRQKLEVSFNIEKNCQEDAQLSSPLPQATIASSLPPMSSAPSSLVNPTTPSPSPTTTNEAITRSSLEQGLFSSFISEPTLTSFPSPSPSLLLPFTSMDPPPPTSSLSPILLLPFTTIEPPVSSSSPPPSPSVLTSFPSSSPLPSFPSSSPLPSFPSSSPLPSLPSSSPLPSLPSSSPLPSLPSSSPLPSLPSSSPLPSLPSSSPLPSLPSSSPLPSLPSLPSSSPLPSPPLSSLGLLFPSLSSPASSTTPSRLLPPPPLMSSALHPRPSMAPTSTTKTEKPTESSLVQLLIVVFAPVVGVLVFSILILCVCICAFIFCCKKKKRHFNDDPSDLPLNILPDSLYPTALEMEKKDEVPISPWMALAWGSISSLPAGVQGIIKRHSVDRRNLSILTTVSRGEYGCIVNGQLNLDANSIAGNKGIMMKMYIGFQKQYGHRDEISRFLECATLLRGLDHPNIHSILKVSVEDNYVPIVIYPIMEYGNLHQFLALCRMAPNDSPLSFGDYGFSALPTLPVTLPYKVRFAYQIIDGMKFLSESGIIHPDLALRNCYLDTNYQVKISDGALSQCFYPECYYTVRGTVRPVRWSAIETLQEGLCTFKSNVWSYGVTLWEVMTLARLPYADEVDHNRCILTHLLMQNRLAHPDGCPDNIYSVMSACWKAHAEDRPNFDTVHSLMHDIYNKYAAIQSIAALTTHGLNDISYSTFGKDLRSHLAEGPPNTTNASYHRRRKSGGSLRGVASRGSPSVSQRNSQNILAESRRNSQNFLGAENLSITFSVLSDDTYLDRSSGESDGEEAGKRLNIEIPSFLTEEKGLENPVSNMEHMRADSPMNMVSTFLPRPLCTSHDQTDHPSTFSSFKPSPPADSLPQHTQPSSLSRINSNTTPTPTASPIALETTSYPSNELRSGTLSSNDNPTPPVPVVTPPPPVGKNGTETASKRSSPDSLAPNSTHPASHIPGIPGSTYNSTSVSIDDVKMRTKSLVNTKDHLTTSASLVSSTPSGASKTDSGIRSDEEVESVLSNGMLSEGKSAPPPVTLPPVKQSMTSLGKENSDTNLGLEDLSSDLMSTFAHWGKD